MARVTLKNVSKVYPGGVEAVREVSVRVEDGEFVVLVGPSGCGKSTTLRMIAGLEEITSGDIHIGDRRVNDVSPSQRDIAMVFQNYALYPHMTVRKNMEFGLRMRRTPKGEIASRVSEAARILGLEPLLDHRPGELSGGQKQRVALGRAIVRKPAAFLFDEPLSNLDAKLRSEMRSEIAALHKRLGATMIYVTHDQVEAMTLGDRLVLMNEGAVQQTGPPLEVYRRPANRFVATFIGSPAMNLMEGEVSAGRFQSSGGVGLAVEGVADGPVVLGVRPEDLLLAHDHESDFATATVTHIEPLGHETLLHVAINGRPWIARSSDGGALPEGGDVRLKIRPGAAHWFAAAGAGQRLKQTPSK